MLIIGWWCSKPITEAIGALFYVPILFYISYSGTPCLQLLPVISSCAASSPHFSSSPSNATAALYLSLIRKSHPSPTTSDKPRLPTPKKIAHRGPESVASQYISQPYSSSFFMYTPISSKHAYSIAATSVGYSHLPPPCLIGFLTVIHCTTLCWKMPQVPLYTGGQDPRL